MSDFYVPASTQHQKKEKAKAQELRNSQWWRQTLGQGICYHCGQKFKPNELTMDHLIPIARGGKSTKNNCVPSCKPCNTKKGSKTTVELVMEQMKSQNEESRVHEVDSNELNRSENKNDSESEEN